MSSLYHKYQLLRKHTAREKFKTNINIENKFIVLNIQTNEQS